MKEHTTVESGLLPQNEIKEISNVIPLCRPEKKSTQVEKPLVRNGSKSLIPDIKRDTDTLDRWREMATKPPVSKSVVQRERSACPTRKSVSQHLYDLDYDHPYLLNTLIVGLILLGFTGLIFWPYNGR